MELWITNMHTCILAYNCAPRKHSLSHRSIKAKIVICKDWCILKCVFFYYLDTQHWKANYMRRKRKKEERTNQALTASESPARPCAFPACRPNTGRQWCRGNKTVLHTHRPTCTICVLSPITCSVSYKRHETGNSKSTNPLFSNFPLFPQQSLYSLFSS